MDIGFKGLQKGIVLSEMAGYTNGEFCASHGRGAALVMLGTYIIHDGSLADYPKDFVFRSEKNSYYNYLKDNIAVAKSSGARVGISAVSINISDSLKFLSTAQEAGADYASYCAHSVMEMFIKNNTSSALLIRNNWQHLKESIRELLKEIKIPVIFKIGAFDNPDVFDAIEVIRNEGISIVHVNIKNNSGNSKGLDFLKKLIKNKLFIIAGGGIKNAESARTILETGADAISIGGASIKKPDLIFELKNMISQTI